LRLGDSYLTIELSVRPSAGKQGFLHSRPNGPVIALRSAPEKGRANRELIDYLAAILDVPARAVTIIKGESARQKVLRVETASAHALAAKLSSAFGSRRV
jgi:uncharacterized protein